MSRFIALASALLLAVGGVPAAWAQDSGAAEEVKALRALVEKQSRQIDGLTEQIAKLRITLEKSGDVPLAAAPAPAAVPTITTTEAAPKAEKPEFSTEVPKAEAADGKRHVVIKGETLTSIAKHYNMLVSDLKKANKDVDERKLQIGQTLTIPTPKSSEKSSEPPAKKEE